jgi:hypothetical protein
MQHGSPSPQAIGNNKTTNTTKHTPNTITIQSISKMTITTTTMSIITIKTTTIMPTINAICNFHI